MERGDCFLRSRQSGPEFVDLPGRDAGAAPAGSGSAGSVRRLAARSGQSVVRALNRQPRLVLATDRSLLPFPDGTPARLQPDQDPREAFADWLLAPGNPWFARSIVNRVWYWLLGRGIVQEPDDIRADNPPENAKLLAWLESELVASHYDVRHVFRLILNS